MTTLFIKSFVMLQIRIDFETFDISPPDFRGQCTTDFFLVTGGSPVPTLCGTNTGQHSKIYIHTYFEKNPNTLCLKKSLLLSRA